MTMLRLARSSPSEGPVSFVRSRAIHTLLRLRPRMLRQIGGRPRPHTLSLQSSFIAVKGTLCKVRLLAPTHRRLEGRNGRKAALRNRLGRLRPLCAHMSRSKVLSRCSERTDCSLLTNAWFLLVANEAPAGRGDGDLVCGRTRSRPGVVCIEWVESGLKFSVARSANAGHLRPDDLRRPPQSYREPNFGLLPLTD